VHRRRQGMRNRVADDADDASASGDRHLDED
jgi:hypothetical protein